jgi:large subunit ribosomal protein L29
MALPKISEARSLSDEQLDAEILAVKRQLFQLRLLLATRRLQKPHEFKHARHRLAQLMTVEAERKRAAAGGASAPEKSAGTESGPVVE